MLYDSLKEKELKLLALRDDVKLLEGERKKKREELNRSSRKTTLKVSELEWKVLMDMMGRRERLKEHGEMLRSALREGEGGGKGYTGGVETNVQQLKSRVQEIISDNRVLEAYNRGENYNSMEETPTAYKYHLENKDETARRLDEMIASLGAQEQQLEKQIKKKQKEYQTVVSK